MLKTIVAGTAIGVAASWAYLRHIMLPVGPSRLGWSQLVFAHRGCRFVEGIPENTVPAFEYAALNCAAGLECDIRQCKTGELVVFHDARLGEHVTNLPEGSDAIADLSFEQLQSLRLKEDVKDRGVKIATLEDVIEICRTNDLKLLIEMKNIPKGGSRAMDAFVDAVLETFKQHDDFLYEHATVISFNPILLYKLRRRDPRIAVFILSTPTIASGATSAEPVPAWMRIAPGLVDRVMHFALTAVVPWVVGVSGVGLPYTSFKDSDVLLWSHRKKVMYFWGFPSPQACTASMRSNGVAVAVDDDFGQFFLKPRYPLQTSANKP